MSGFLIFTRNQVSCESIDEYVSAFKFMRHCKFEHIEEGLIRDRIVCGVTDENLRDRLPKADELTLTKAVKLYQANKMTVREKWQLKGSKAESSCGGATSYMKARWQLQPS